MTRLRRALRYLLLALVILGLVPGLTELVENVEHWLHDGHAPHSAEHMLVAEEEGHSDGGAEHGCTPMAHQCGCHTSMAASVPPLPMPIESARCKLAIDARSAALERDGPRRSVPPPVRPPIV